MKVKTSDIPPIIPGWFIGILCWHLLINFGFGSFGDFLSRGIISALIMGSCAILSKFMDNKSFSLNQLVLGPFLIILMLAGTYLGIAAILTSVLPVPW